MNLQVVLFQPIGGGAIALRVDDESTSGMGSDCSSDAFHHIAGFVRFYRRLCDRPHSKEEKIHTGRERERVREPIRSVAWLRFWIIWCVRRLYPWTFILFHSLRKINTLTKCIILICTLLHSWRRKYYMYDFPWIISSTIYR